MKRTALVLIASVLIARPVHAQAAPLSLVQAQAEARAHAPEVGELEARVRGAEGIAAPSSRALHTNPSLGVGYETGALGGEREEYSATADLSWTLDVSGSWGPRGRAANAEVERTRMEREDGLRALDEAVAIALAELAHAQRSAERARRVSALYTVGAEASQRQLAVGQGDQLQVDATRLDEASALANLAQTKGEVTIAQVRLARLLGRETSSDLLADDPIESSDAERRNLGGMVESDPRVLGALAELRAARFGLESEERNAWPSPTFGLGYAFRHREVPLGAISGPGGAGLSALWSDQEVGATVSVPLSIFDRQQLPRAQSNARILAAEARLRATRAAVRVELDTARASLTAAGEAYAAVAQMPAVIDRGFGLVERAVRAGALDAVARAQMVRRLLEGGRRLDAAVLDLRIARAKWTRRVTN